LAEVWVGVVAGVWAAAPAGVVVQVEVLGRKHQDQGKEKQQAWAQDQLWGLAGVLW